MEYKFDIIKMADDGKCACATATTIACGYSLKTRRCMYMGCAECVFRHHANHLKMAADTSSGSEKVCKLVM